MKHFQFSGDALSNLGFKRWKCSSLLPFDAIAAAAGFTAQQKGLVNRHLDQLTRVLRASNAVSKLLHIRGARIPIIKARTPS